MKKLFLKSVLVLSILFISTQAMAVEKGSKSLGLDFVGFYTINSRLESVYVNFSTQNINAAGFGATAFFEYGLSDRFGLEFDIGYSRLTYSDKFSGVIRENFLVADLVGHYYFSNNQKIQPYFIFGAGVVASSNGAAPTFDAGIGSHFYVAKDFSIKTEILIKTAVIYNRAEARIGFAYHF
ncbi:hypothetical protein BVY03_01745 [bacterium K02(2017)]|nr:hypothetical protein BVY03_01745 [bacterium K02(2017)]